ncbi:MAG TPA: butyrate kinase [Candidatus Eubacterium avistercoris]|uniref:Probable butyrate kinase n=1 Tax=Candidatus Eubacterium avistercoris TaxID=2838567 RepID=A0A9D2IGG3_9FIRM|nr:butyrate kinase [Candidatus Eubacterium avistercoris]
MLILVLNFGGTSGKLAVYEDTKCIEEYSFDYSQEELDLSLPAEVDVRKRADAVLKWLDSIGYKVEDFDAIAPRLGATFYGGDGGTFKIEGVLKEVIEKKFVPGKPLMHALFGTIKIVDYLLETTDKDIPIYVTDPASIDQFIPEAKITGLPGAEKRASFHALSQRAAARKAAEELGKEYNEVNIVVAHMGGGLSIGAHEHGRIVDTTDSTGDGDGPFSAKRAGSVPSGAIIKMCFSGKYTEDKMYRLVRNQAGLEGYLGTSDLRVIEKRIEDGDKEAELIFNALAYQISREIAACFASLHGHADGIAFTGGMSKSKKLIQAIRERIGVMAPFFIYPGDLENDAIAAGAYRALKGLEPLAVYNPEDEYKNAFSK